jgi:hypothetical protein
LQQNLVSFFWGFYNS